MARKRVFSAEFPPAEQVDKKDFSSIDAAIKFVAEGDTELTTMLKTLKEKEYLPEVIKRIRAIGYEKGTEGSIKQAVARVRKELGFVKERTQTASGSGGHVGSGKATKAATVPDDAEQENRLLRLVIEFGGVDELVSKIKGLGV